MPGNLNFRITFCNAFLSVIDIFNCRPLSLEQVVLYYWMQNYWIYIVNTYKSWHQRRGEMGRSHALLFGFLWCCHSAIGDSTSLHVPIFNSQTRHLFLVFSTQNCFLVELNTITMDFSYFNSNLSVGTKKTRLV